MYDSDDLVPLLFAKLRDPYGCFYPPLIIRTITTPFFKRRHDGSIIKSTGKDAERDRDGVAINVPLDEVGTLLQTLPEPRMRDFAPGPVCPECACSSSHLPLKCSTKGR